MSPTPAPPNPDDLQANTAAALAEEVGRVYEYLARIASGAATIAEQCVDIADRNDDDELDEAQGTLRDVSDFAEQAYRAARRATDTAQNASSTDVLAWASEDIDPAAVAEVAAHLAKQIAAALHAIAPTPRN